MVTYSIAGRQCFFSCSISAWNTWSALWVMYLSVQLVDAEWPLSTVVFFMIESLSFRHLEIQQSCPQISSMRLAKFPFPGMFGVLQLVFTNCPFSYVVCEDQLSSIADCTFSFQFVSHGPSHRAAAHEWPCSLWLVSLLFVLRCFRVRRPVTNPSQMWMRM